ncbi:MAG: amino acid permease [Alphaproteobacteria bacterium]|nr:amino acid permease [Alphaproteobacteria bacterium]
MPNSEHQKKDLNLLNVVSLGLGSIIGAGIFALLGQVILLAGQRTYLAFIIAGIAAMLSGYSYAKLAGRYPQSGGLTDYFHIAFKNKFVSGGLSLVYMIASAVSIAMLAKSFGIYAVELIKPSENHLFYINLYAVGLTLLLAWLNMQTAADVGWVETLIVILKLSILIVIIGAAYYQSDLKLSVIPTKYIKHLDFLRSVGVTFFAYAGYGVITNAAANVNKPKRTMSLAIYITLSIVMLIYLNLAYVVLNYTPQADLLHDTETSIATVANKLLGQWGYYFLYLAAGLAFISGINATFFSMFRISQALGKFKVLPKMYTVALTPNATYGNAFTTILIVLSIIFMDFSSIVNLSSAAFLLSYLGIFAANWNLRTQTDASANIILIGSALMSVILVGFIVSLM